MRKIFFISGPCGCGKSTFADAYAKHLVRQNHKPVYVIHGDDYHQGFVEPEDKPGFFVDGLPSDRVMWEDILRFNWDCIIQTAEKVLQQELDVVIDYVIEDELPRVQSLADENDAELYYIVLTADADEIEKRIRQRGDTDLTERALFLKRKLESMPENRGHLYNTTGKTPADTIREFCPEQYRIRSCQRPTEETEEKSQQANMCRQAGGTADASVRKAKPEDIRTAAKLAAALWTEHSAEELAGEMKALLADDECAVYLCEEHGEAIGFAQCGLRHDYVEGTETSPVGYLEGIYVKGPHRRKGIARTLLGACEDWARSKGCTEFASDCELTNIGSQDFHQAVGFREANRIVAYARQL